MVTKNSCSCVLSYVKTCVVSTVWQEIPQSFDPHFQPFSLRKCFYYEKFYYGWRGGVTGTFENLCNSADDELFIKIRTSSNHILHMHSCHHHLPHHRTTVLDSVYTHFSYLNAQHVSLTVISWCACCTKTPTRPIVFILFYFTIFFLCYELGIATVLVHNRSNVFLMFRCAFCHALFPAALSAAQTCRYLIYSEADFEVFRPPIGATIRV